VPSEDRSEVREPGADHARGRRLARHFLRPERHPERYFFLFGLLLFNIFLLAVARAGTWQTFGYVVIVGATLLLALTTSEARPAAIRIAWVAAILAALLAFVVAVTNATGLTGYIYIVLVALLLLSPLSIGRRILLSRRVTLQTLIAALDVYLMIGLLFTFVYLAINTLHPNFFAQGQQTDPSIYLYFSYITMTTVGYGDFTPGNAIPRAFVVFEAVLGQIFLVTAVARLVSLYSAEAPAPGSVAEDLEERREVPPRGTPGIGDEQD
jgi:hypothetical protein